MNMKWYYRILLALGVIFFVVLGALTRFDGRDTTNQNGSIQTVGGFDFRTLRIGPMDVYAMGSADYGCDGVDDNIQWQQAINALPASGGKIVVYGFNYHFSNNVTRASSNITFEGVGKASYIYRDGVLPCFIDGGNYWSYKNLAIDAGGIDHGAYTTWAYEGVTIGTTYYAYATGTSITGASWAIPTGRGATIVVAASDSSAREKAQADYVCASDNTQSTIQTAINSLSAVGGSVILLPGTYRLNAVGSYNFSSQHNGGVIPYSINILSSNTTLINEGSFFINNNQNCAAVLVGDNTTATYNNVTVKLAKVDGNRANNAPLTTCSIGAFRVTGGYFEANGYSCSSGNIILSDCTGCTVKGYAYDCYCHNFALEWSTACQMDVSAESGGHVAALILGGGYNYVRATQKNFVATGGGNTAASSAGGVQIYASDTYGNTGTSQGHNIVDFTGYGITTDDCKGVYIYGTGYDPVGNNIVKVNINGYRYGVVLEGETYSNKIEGIINGCAYQGVIVGGYQNNLSGLSIGGCGRQGIADSGYDTIISSSTVLACSQNTSATYAGIQLSGTKGQISGCKIGDDGTKLHLAEIELASTSSGYLIGENYLGSRFSPSKGIINQGSNNSIGKSSWDGYTSSLSQIRSEIASMLGILGDTRLLLPFYETSGTTVHDLSAWNHNATVLTNLNTWTSPPRLRGRLPYVSFNGSASSGLWIADSGDFTFGNSLTDSPFTIVCVASKTAGSPYGILIAKDQDPPAPGGREWRLDWTDAFKLRLILTDNSTAASLVAESTALTDTDLHIIIVTYSGSSTFAGIKMYVDDVQLALTDGSDVGYVAMENGTAKVTVGMMDVTGASGWDYWHNGLDTWNSVSAGALSRNDVHVANQLILSLMGY